MSGPWEVMEVKRKVIEAGSRQGAPLGCVSGAPRASGAMGWWPPVHGQPTFLGGIFLTAQAPPCIFIKVAGRELAGIMKTDQLYGPNAAPLCHVWKGPGRSGHHPGQASSPQQGGRAQLMLCGDSRRPREKEPGGPSLSNIGILLFFPCPIWEMSAVSSALIPSVGHCSLWEDRAESSGKGANQVAPRPPHVAAQRSNAIAGGLVACPPGSPGSCCSSLLGPGSRLTDRTHGTVPMKPGVALGHYCRLPVPQFPCRGSRVAVRGP